MDCDSIFNLDVFDVCFAVGSPMCEASEASWKRGLREGVALAREWACAEIEYADDGSGPDRWASIDWADVDAELARRVGGGG